MKLFAVLLTTVFLSAGFANAANRCDAPLQPDVVLDVNSASERDVFNAFHAVKSYQRDLAAYRDCLDSASGNDARRDALFNESVDQEQELVTAFNEVLSVFRARRSSSEAR